MRFAVLPAAGKSLRMGRPKLSLPLGERTILEHVLAALHQAGVEHILVVLPPHGGELATVARKAGAYVHLLAEETADMRATVQQGLSWLEQRFPPRSDDAWLLVPADHPTLSSSVVGELDKAHKNHPECSIFVPTFDGRRGHPLALTWRHVAGMRAHVAGEGWNSYVRQHADDVREVAVETESVLWDLDTPEDYERLRRNWPTQFCGFA
jgi:molybdenum cofactor cytidylyltransferase